MPAGLSSHRDLSRRPRKPNSSRDLSIYSNQELDQLRKSNATIRLTKKQAIKLFFWDPERRTVFYWTRQTWIFVMTFYPLFIVLICAMFYGMMLLIVLWVKAESTHEPIVKKISLTKEPTYYPQ